MGGSRREGEEEEGMKATCYNIPSGII